MVSVDTPQQMRSINDILNVAFPGNTFWCAISYLILPTFTETMKLKFRRNKFRKRVVYKLEARIRV